MVVTLGGIRAKAHFMTLRRLSTFPTSITMVAAASLFGLTGTAQAQQTAPAAGCSSIGAESTTAMCGRRLHLVVYHDGSDGQLRRRTGRSLSTGLDRLLRLSG